MPLYPERKKTRLIKNRELEKLFADLDRAGLEQTSFAFGIRRQFAIAARMSEIITMRWDLAIRAAEALKGTLSDLRHAEV